jgi:aryl-alcohol dehydrogenase-like predicted oxidoreductase
MRYRPFGTSGKAVSAVSLALRQSGGPATAQAWRSLIFAGMENGINCFDIGAGSEALERGVAEALQAVERRLLFLIFTIQGNPLRPLSAEALADLIRQGLKRTAAGYFDVLMLDEAAYAALTPQAILLLKRVREANMTLQLGVAGDGETLNDCIKDPAYDVLATSYNLTSEWRARRLLREAAAAGMTAIAYDVAPAALVRPAKEFKLPKLRKQTHQALAGAGTYAFLHETSRWTAEELCVAYALTEPSLATLQIDMSLMGQMEALAAVPDRDPPTALGAQVEMARFSSEQPDQRRQA